MKSFVKKIFLCGILLINQSYQVSFCASPEYEMQDERQYDVFDVVDVVEDEDDDNPIQTTDVNLSKLNYVVDFEHNKECNNMISGSNYTIDSVLVGQYNTDEYKLNTLDSRSLVSGREYCKLNDNKIGDLNNISIFPCSNNDNTLCKLQVANNQLKVQGRLTTNSNNTIASVLLPSNQLLKNINIFPLIKTNSFTLVNLDSTGSEYVLDVNNLTNSYIIYKNDVPFAKFYNDDQKWHLTDSNGNIQNELLDESQHLISNSNNIRKYTIINNTLYEYNGIKYKYDTIKNKWYSANSDGAEELNKPTLVIAPNTNCVINDNLTITEFGKLINNGTLTINGTMSAPKVESEPIQLTLNQSDNVDLESLHENLIKLSQTSSITNIWNDLFKFIQTCQAGAVDLRNWNVKQYFTDYNKILSIMNSYITMDKLIALGNTDTKIASIMNNIKQYKNVVQKNWTTKTFSFTTPDSYKMCLKAFKKINQTEVKNAVTSFINDISELLSYTENNNSSSNIQQPIMLQANNSQDYDKEILYLDDIAINNNGTIILNGDIKSTDENNSASYPIIRGGNVDISSFITFEDGKISIRQNNINSAFYNANIYLSNKDNPWSKDVINCFKDNGNFSGSSFHNMKFFSDIKNGNKVTETRHSNILVPGIISIIEDKTEGNNSSSNQVKYCFAGNVISSEFSGINNVLKLFYDDSELNNDDFKNNTPISVKIYNDKNSLYNFLNKPNDFIGDTVLDNCGLDLLSLTSHIDSSTNNKKHHSDGIVIDYSKLDSNGIENLRKIRFVTSNNENNENLNLTLLPSRIEIKDNKGKIKKLINPEIDMSSTYANWKGVITISDFVNKIKLTDGTYIIKAHDNMHIETTGNVNLIFDNTGTLNLCSLVNNDGGKLSISQYNMNEQPLQLKVLSNEQNNINIDVNSPSSLHFTNDRKLMLLSKYDKVKQSVIEYLATDMSNKQTKFQEANTIIQDSISDVNDKLQEIENSSNLPFFTHNYNNQNNKKLELIFPNFKKIKNNNRKATKYEKYFESMEDDGTIKEGRSDIKPHDSIVEKKNALLDLNTHKIQVLDQYLKLLKDASNTSQTDNIMEQINNGAFQLSDSIQNQTKMLMVKYKHNNKENKQQLSKDIIDNMVKILNTVNHKLVNIESDKPNNEYAIYFKLMNEDGKFDKPTIYSLIKQCINRPVPNWLIMLRDLAESSNVSLVGPVDVKGPVEFKVIEIVLNNPLFKSIINEHNSTIAINQSKIKVLEAYTQVLDDYYNLYVKPKQTSIKDIFEKMISKHAPILSKYIDVIKDNLGNINAQEIIKQMFTKYIPMLSEYISSVTSKSGKINSGKIIEQISKYIPVLNESVQSIKDNLGEIDVQEVIQEINEEYAPLLSEYIESIKDDIGTMDVQEVVTQIVSKYTPILNEYLKSIKDNLGNTNFSDIIKQIFVKYIPMLNEYISSIKKNPNKIDNKQVKELATKYIPSLSKYINSINDKHNNNKDYDDIKTITSQQQKIMQQLMQAKSNQIKLLKNTLYLLTKISKQIIGNPNAIDEQQRKTIESENRIINIAKGIVLDSINKELVSALKIIDSKLVDIENNTAKSNYAKYFQAMDNNGEVIKNREDIKSYDIISKEQNKIIDINRYKIKMLEEYIVSSNGYQNASDKSIVTTKKHIREAANKYANIINTQSTSLKRELKHSIQTQIKMLKNKSINEKKYYSPRITDEIETLEFKLLYIDQNFKEMNKFGINRTVIKEAEIS